MFGWDNLEHDERAGIVIGFMMACGIILSVVIGSLLGWLFEG